MYDPFTYWEERANGWTEQKFPTKRQWNQIKEFIDPKWSVLELGSGTGRWSEYFKDYTGTDISLELVSHANNTYGNKFFYHDMRIPLENNWDLIFTYTAWLHVPPADIAKVTLPDTNYLFVEPHKDSQVSYCFNHDYEQLFGVTKLKQLKDQIVWGRFISDNKKAISQKEKRR